MTEHKTPHEQWVASGRCPYIGLTKAWCNEKVNNHSRHWAPLRLPDGKTKRVEI